MNTSDIPSVLSKQSLVDFTRKVLRGQQLDLKHYGQLLLLLEKRELFAYASELILKKIKVQEKAGQQVPISDYHRLVKYIYKDTSLPADFRYKEALRVLTAADDLRTTRSCESLGLAGAIYKYRWLQLQHSSDLEKSIFYYKQAQAKWRSFNKMPAEIQTRFGEMNDTGWTAINYAFMLEEMACYKLESLGECINLNSEVVARLQEVENVRKYVIKWLTDPELLETEKNAYLEKMKAKPWYHNTLSEAYFGLRNYDKAKEYLLDYFKIQQEDVINEFADKKESELIMQWHVKTFTRQMNAAGRHHLLLKDFYRNTTEQQENEETEGFEKTEIEKTAAGATIKNNYLKQFSEEVNEDKVKIFLTLLYSQGKTTKLTISQIKKGKVGLALSGGGFRASLFHIGTLAALAELDKLKNIEVLSCVSGGSIIGAYYYLKLKGLLERKPDGEITRQDYIEMVQEIETDFLNNVQKNIRMRLFRNPLNNLFMIIGINPFDYIKGKKPFRGIKSMLLEDEYNRTHRLAELYEKVFYNPEYKRQEAMKQGIDPDKPEKKVLCNPICMSDLFIAPKGSDSVNDLESYNLTRQNKIPQLVINATSLNTGHNWQFTASWMGEPAGSIQSDIDVKPRLRRMYYGDAPAGYNRFRLGYAVAASSCVPALFNPLSMYGLYDDIPLQLVDGGVHDNQGIGSLLEQECSQVVISDASGQMSTNNSKSTRMLSVFIRTDTIFQERIRELQFRDIKERASRGSLSDLSSSHLKSGLNKNPISWHNCADPPREIYHENEKEQHDGLTEYGIQKDVQGLLSEIRTDLDSFNDKEALSLMYSGYTQTMLAFGKNRGITSFCKWRFLEIAEHLSKPDKAELIKPFLKAGSKRFFKYVYISWLKWVTLLFLIVASVVLIYCIVQYWDYIVSVNFQKNIPFKVIVVTGLTYAASMFSDLIAGMLNYKMIYRQKLNQLIALTFLSLLSNFYLVVVNPFYNRLGRVKKQC